MNHYLLNSEKNRINILLDAIENNLYQINTLFLKEQFTNLIRDNKDASIEDILNNLLENLNKEMTPLLDNNLTLGTQFGIKNNYFEIESYGGYYLSKNNLYNINIDTLFSFDSISKIITSIITMYQVRNKIFTLDTTISQYNNNYNLDAPIKSILKFTAHIKTKQRIDNLSKEETISLLKECKENLIDKQQYKNYYKYNDIGYMILRQIIPNFLSELDSLLLNIDNKNLTYKNKVSNITGGKIGEENITPDPKGREITFPGHTGLYGNITGLLNLFSKITETSSILTEEEKNILLKQPYQDPIVYNLDGTPKIARSNNPEYITKVAGLFRMPYGTKPPYNKPTDFNVSNSTTRNVKASAGTCGSWVTNDNLSFENMFGSYTAGILTNPYSFVENKKYPNKINKLPNTPLEVNEKGVIINYLKTLNKYKEILTNYAILLELITEYIKQEHKEQLLPKKLVKKII